MTDDVMENLERQKQEIVQNMTKKEGSIYEALNAAQLEVKDPERQKTVKVKSKSGTRYDFSYATFNQGLDIFRDVFAKHGLAFYQGVVWLESKPHILTTIVHGPTRGTIETYWPISGFDWNNPQSAGSATTYAKRYALFAIMGINGDDDDDANIAEGNEYKDKKKGNDAKLKDPYDALFLKNNWEIVVDGDDENFLKEFFRYSKRAKDGGEVVTLVDHNLDRLGNMDADLRKRFLVRLDKEFDDIDDGTGLPNEFRNILQPQT